MEVCSLEKIKSISSFSLSDLSEPPPRHSPLEHPDYPVPWGKTSRSICDCYSLLLGYVQDDEHGDSQTSVSLTSNRHDDEPFSPIYQLLHANTVPRADAFTPL